MADWWSETLLSPVQLKVMLWYCRCYIEFNNPSLFVYLFGYVMTNRCVWRWSLHAGVLLLLLLINQVFTKSISEVRSCHSCASLSYLNVWSQLMQTYFPPVNYTDHCWEPVFDMGSVACSSACFTMVEQIASQSCESIKNLPKTLSLLCNCLNF